jgi:hypothetical protein
MTFVPQEVDLTGLIGYDYSETFNFWADDNDTQPYDFSNWTNFSCLLGATAYSTTLNANGEGLIVNPTAGSIQLVLSHLTASTQHPGSRDYQISAVDPGGKLEPLMFGIFWWKAL